MIPRRYIFVGFESDDKPVDVLPGTLYADWRTGRVYIFTGGEWIEYGASTTTVTETTSDSRVTVNKSGNVIEVKDENGNTIYSSNYFSDAMSAAVAYAEENSLYVYIDEGTYQVDDNSVTVLEVDDQQAYILIASNVAIKGTGKGKTIIEFSPNYISSPQQGIVGIIAPVVEDLTLSTGLEADWNAASIMFLPIAAGFPEIGYDFSSVRIKNIDIEGESKTVYVWGRSSNLVENCNNIMLSGVQDANSSLTITNSSIIGGYDLGFGIGGYPLTVTNSTFSSNTHIAGTGTISNSVFRDTCHINTGGPELLTVENCSFSGTVKLNYSGIWPLIVKSSTFDCDSIVLHDKTYFTENRVFRCSTGYISVPANEAMVARNLIKDCTVYITSNSDKVAVIDNIFYMNGYIPSHSYAIIQGNVKW